MIRFIEARTMVSEVELSIGLVRSWQPNWQVVIGLLMNWVGRQNEYEGIKTTICSMTEVHDDSQEIWRVGVIVQVRKLVVSSISASDMRQRWTS